MRSSQSLTVLAAAIIVALGATLPLQTAQAGNMGGGGGGGSMPGGVCPPGGGHGGGGGHSIVINKPITIYKPVTINNNIDASKNIVINKPVTITNNINASKNINIEKNISIEKNINIEKNITINKGGSGGAVAIAISQAFASAMANSSSNASASASSSYDSSVALSATVGAEAGALGNGQGGGGFRGYSYGDSQVIYRGSGGDIGSAEAQPRCQMTVASVIKSIHAVCVAPNGQEFPASHMTGETWIDGGFEGEVARCIPGSHLKVLIGEVSQSNEGMAASYTKGLTLICGAHEALRHYKDGLVKCAPAVPVPDCTERTNLRRYGTADFFFTYRAQVCVTPAEADHGLTLNGLSLNGGVGE